MPARRLAILLATATLLACEQPETAVDEPRVFFVGVETGAKVESPLELEFGAASFEIEPVGDGILHLGAGHFHLGVGARCLPGKTPIPTADPWIHFTDGSNTIELDLPPGKHSLVLQAGDGEHRTLHAPGLCQEIRISVEDRTKGTSH